MSTHVTIAIRAGAELVSEPFSATDARVASAFAAAQTNGYIDGGLDIVVRGQRLSWPDIWDYVDGMMLAWLRGLDEIAAGAATAIAQFPDTKVECELSRSGDKAVRIEYEDVDAIVDLQSLRDEISGAAQRLIQLAAMHSSTTPALDELRKRQRK